MDYTKDTKVWDKLKKNLIGLNDLAIKVGWFESQRYGADNNNIAMAQVAFLNEMGHTNGPDSLFPGTETPARPYMRIGFRDYLMGGRSDQNFLAIIEYVVSGGTVMRAMKQGAPYFVKALQNTMDEWDTPPNARSTQRIKGFNDPLNNTHQLIDNVSYEVGKQGKD